MRQRPNSVSFNNSSYNRPLKPSTKASAPACLVRCNASTSVPGPTGQNCAESVGCRYLRQSSRTIGATLSRHRLDRPGFGHTNQPRSRTWTPTAQAELVHWALISSTSSKRSWSALVSQAGKPKGGCERDGCGPKKDFVAFLFIHHNVFEAL